jgi:acetyl-CoA carboxylase biotin carboxyl carrier protein
MPLGDEDIREILRIIGDSDLDELRIETDGLLLHVRKKGGHDEIEPEPRLPVASTAGQPQEPAPAAPEQNDLVAIESPMLGSFYRAEAPGGKPLVEVGSRVEPDTSVCIIEVMKMMNSVTAGVSGTIVEICLENGQMAEYGQPLFRVQPS